MDLGRTFGVVVAAVGYTLAVTLMVIATTQHVEHVQRALVGWALLTFGASMVVTGAVLLERSRAKLIDYLAHQELRQATSALHDDRRPTPIR